MFISYVPEHPSDTLSARGLENDLAHLHLGKHVTLDSSRNFSTSRIFYPRYISFQIGSLRSIKSAQQPERCCQFPIHCQILTYDLIVIWQRTLSLNLRIYSLIGLIFDYRFFIHGHQQLTLRLCNSIRLEVKVFIIFLFCFHVANAINERVNLRNKKLKILKGEHILFHFKDKIEILKHNCEQIWNINWNVNFYKKELHLC